MGSTQRGQILRFLLHTSIELLLLFISNSFGKSVSLALQKFELSLELILNFVYNCSAKTLSRFVLFASINCTIIIQFYSLLHILIITFQFQQSLVVLDLFQLDLLIFLHLLLCLQCG